MNILLTGATGFVGRNLLLRLLGEDVYESIFVVLRNPKKLEEQLKGEGFNSVPEKIKILKAEAPSWDFPVPEGVDHVVHAAGVLFGRTREQYLNANAEGTANLLRKLGPGPRVVVLSSQVASGPCQEGQVCRLETDLDVPLTWYGESKLEMERRLIRDFSSYNYLCLRPPMILGPRDTATLPLFKLVKNPVQVKPGFDTKYYSFVGVDDLNDAIMTALRSKTDFKNFETRHFFVASPTTISDRDLIGETAKVSGRALRLVSIPHFVVKGISMVVDTVPYLRNTIPSLTKDRAKEIFHSRWVVSAESFGKEFSWSAKQSLGDALYSTLEWYRKTGQIS